MKRQAITVLSIAAISFLIGTMFSVMATESGNPFDKIWEAFTGLQSEVETLEDRIETLEEQSLPQGFINAPAYDSGWTNFGNFLEPTAVWHGLGTTELFVYIMSNHTAETIWWGSLTENEIVIERETINRSWKIRMMIWKISEPPA